MVLIAIGIAGATGSGKDTLCDAIISSLSTTNLKVKKISFADSLRDVFVVLTSMSVSYTRDHAGKNLLLSQTPLTKYVARDRVIDSLQAIKVANSFITSSLVDTLINILYTKDNDDYTCRLPCVTVGRYMQIIGDEAFRQNIHQDVWVQVWKRKASESNCQVVISSDLRYTNEVSAIESFDHSYILHLHRDTTLLCGRDANHSSETSFTCKMADQCMYNNSTIDALKEVARRISDHCNSLMVD